MSEMKKVCEICGTKSAKVFHKYSETENISVCNECNGGVLTSVWRSDVIFKQWMDDEIVFHELICSTAKAMQRLITSDLGSAKKSIQFKVGDFVELKQDDDTMNSKLFPAEVTQIDGNVVELRGLVRDLTTNNYNSFVWTICDLKKSEKQPSEDRMRVGWDNYCSFCKDKSKSEKHSICTFDGRNYEFHAHIDCYYQFTNKQYSNVMYVIKSQKDFDYFVKLDVHSKQRIFEELFFNDKKEISLGNGTILSLNKSVPWAEKWNKEVHKDLSVDRAEENKTLHERIIENRRKGNAIEEKLICSCDIVK